MKLLKEKFYCVLLILGMVISIIPVSVKSSASGYLFDSETICNDKIINVTMKKTYTEDLNKDGVDENIVFTKKILTDKAILNITINGNIVKSFKRYGYDYYVQLLDIDENDGKTDIWIGTFGDSADYTKAELYQYDGSKLNRIYNLNYKNIYSTKNDELVLNQCPGMIESTDGNGTFSVCMDRAVACDIVTGNHYDLLNYKLSNSKVTWIKSRTFEIYDFNAYSENGSDYLKAAQKLNFYVKHDKNSGVAFSIKKNGKVKPIKTYITKSCKIYVLYENETGETGWLCSNDYDYEKNKAFKNMLFAD